MALDDKSHFLAGCTVRGFFPASRAKRWGKWLENDLRKKGIDATPLTQRVGWMSCLLMLSIHCDETVEQKVKGALILLGFEFMDSNVVDAVQI